MGPWDFNGPRRNNPTTMLITNAKMLMMILKSILTSKYKINTKCYPPLVRDWVELFCSVAAIKIEAAFLNPPNRLQLQREKNYSTRGNALRASLR